MDPDRVAKILFADLVSVAPESYAVTYDGPSRMKNDSNDDYFVDREILIQPKIVAACPIEVWLSDAGVGMGFDTWRTFASRVGASSKTTRFVFGFEPIELTESQLHTILLAILMGEAEARYTVLWGKLIRAYGGVIKDVGLPSVQARRWGKKFRYAPYAA